MWKIRLNPGKTKVTNIGKGKQQIKNCDLSMNDHKLEVVDKIDYNLNFGNHFQEILNPTKGLYIKLFSLKSINFKLTPPTIINLYKTFIRSCIEYGNSATCCLNKSSLVKLEQLQLNVLRFALNIQKGIKNDITRKSANIASMQERIVNLGSKWLKKAISNNPDIAQFVNNFAFRGSNTLDI